VRRGGERFEVLAEELRIGYGEELAVPDCLLGEVAEAEELGWNGCGGGGG
jgi:hypothetical protein